MLAGQFLPRLALLISVVSWWLGWEWEIRTALHTCLADWSTFSLQKKADRLVWACLCSSGHTAASPRTSRSMSGETQKFDRFSLHRIYCFPHGPEQATCLYQEPVGEWTSSGLGYSRSPHHLFFYDRMKWGRNKPRSCAFVCA